MIWGEEACGRPNFQAYFSVIYFQFRNKKQRESTNNNFFKLNSNFHWFVCVQIRSEITSYAFYLAFWTTVAKLSEPI